MKPKTVVTAALLLFVITSIVHLIVKETGGKSEQNVTKSGVTADQEQTAHPTTSSDNTISTAKVIIYYFHGNARCMTCRTIEACTKEAIDSGFSTALKDGRLEWRVINVDEPDNERYVQGFQLSTRSVVLERLAGGKRLEWKNLQRVWDFVHGDKEDFLKYIQDETKAYLEAMGK